ncbi:MAG: hypothetical protein Q9170_003761 [Blastenia crenularia]
MNQSLNKHGVTSEAIIEQRPPDPPQRLAMSALATLVSGRRTKHGRLGVNALFQRTHNSGRGGCGHDGQTYTQPFLSSNLDHYTFGMLPLCYRTAWSNLMIRLGKDNEPATFRPASPIVSASIDFSKLYIWLAMHANLTISAMLVFFDQCVSETKTIHNTALAALTTDLTDVTRGKHGTRTVLTRGNRPESHT